MTVFESYVLDGQRASRLKRARARADHHLCAYVAGEVAGAGRYGPAHERVWRVAEEQICGGKLIRPSLFLCAVEEFSGSDADADMLDLAIAIELLHFSFLLHDDVIDEDLMRRGKPNFIASLAAQAPPGVGEDARLHWARSSAILMGDLILSTVHRLFARTRNEQLWDILEHTITASVVGEQVDVELSDGIQTASMERVLEASQRKTATYTFELPLRAAAIVTEADPRVHEVLVSVANHLGLAFQLQDDVMSVFGDEHTHGKDFCSDLREGKMTALMAHAAGTTVWSQIEPTLGRTDLGPADAERVRDLLVQSGSADHVNGLIDGALDGLHSTLTEAAGVVPARVTDLIRLVAESIRGRSV